MVCTKMRVQLPPLGRVDVRHRLDVPVVATPSEWVTMYNSVVPAGVTLSIPVVAKMAVSIRDIWLKMVSPVATEKPLSSRGVAAAIADPVVVLSAPAVAA